MKKAVSGRVIIDVAVRLRKVTVTVTGSDAIFGTLTDTVFSFTCRCHDRHSITSNGKNESEVPKELVTFLKYVKADLAGSEEAFDDPYVEQLQQFIRGIKGSREMEERFMIFEEMLKEERAAGDSSTKNLDADRFPVKNIGRIYTEDVIHI